MFPMPQEWWLRPVSSAWRVGEQSAVVWKRLYFKPPAASFSSVGVWHGPPKALEEPNPASSISTISTLGAPLGGRSCGIGGYLVFGSFASYVIWLDRIVFGIGSCDRSCAQAAVANSPIRVNARNPPTTRLYLIEMFLAPR